MRPTEKRIETRAVRRIPRAVPLARTLIASLGALFAGCDGADPAPPSTTTDQGVVVTDLSPGAGEPLRDGDYIRLHYDARIARVGDGGGEPTPYDSTRSGEPLLIKVGAGHLLPGFADGLRGMRIGGRRRMLLPPDTAHGAVGRGRVPAHAWLEYDVQVIDRFVRREDGIQYLVLEEGAGDPPTRGQYVAIEQKTFLLETGRLLSDTQHLGSTLAFMIGAPEVIPGLDRILQSMAPRSRWQVALPPDLAFGPLGTGTHVLPGQDVVMEIRLLRINKR
jgi:FKBP-type peptidyl-prolyl cis-trans isomerase